MLQNIVIYGTRLPADVKRANRVNLFAIFNKRSEILCVSYSYWIFLWNSRWLCVQANDRFRVQNARRACIICAIVNDAKQRGLKYLKSLKCEVHFLVLAMDFKHRLALFYNAVVRDLDMKE